MAAFFDIYFILPVEDVLKVHELHEFTLIKEIQFSYSVNYQTKQFVKFVDK